MADSLERDVQALKERLRDAWSYLAKPSLTRFERQEIRNQIKQSDAELRACLQRLAAQYQERSTDLDAVVRPEPQLDFRILNI
jgi:DNA repair exonuclease SbcCD ATPase subunit